MSWHNDYIRIPFADRGRTRDGTDCWGMVRLIYAEKLNVELPSLLHYVNTEDKTALIRGIEEHDAKHNWALIPKGQEQEFDVPVFNICGMPMHVGVVVRPGYMVHCQRDIGTSFETYRGHRWFNRLEGFYRYAENSSCPITVPPTS